MFTTASIVEGAVGVPRLSRTPRASGAAPRGTVMVAVLLALLLLSFVAFAMTSTGARDANFSSLAVQALRAEYAAEAVANMAVKEVLDNVDHDGDGVIGSISNDGNTATDPTMNSSTRMWATRTEAGGIITLTARAANNDARRAIQITLSSGSSSSLAGANQLFYTRDSSAGVARSLLDGSTNAWASPTTSGSTPLVPIWAATAGKDGSTIVLASNSSSGLYYGLADSSGTATYSSICSDIGSISTRPFTVAVEPLSRNGLIVYYDQTQSSVQYRTLSGSTLSAAASVGTAAGTVSWVQLATMSNNSNEMMALMVDTNKDAYVARWTGSGWTDQVRLTTTMNNATNEEAAIAVEALSGRVLAVYSDTGSNRVGWRVYTPGSGWSAVTYLTGLGGSSRWVRLASRPGTNEIFLAVMVGNQDVLVAQWNGSTWSTPTVIVNSTGSLSVRGFDIACSPDGTDVMVVYGKGSSAVCYRTWTGSGWSTENSAFTLSSGQNRKVQVRPGVSDSGLIVAVGDSNGGVNASSWNGTSFGTLSRLGTTSTSYSSREWFSAPVSTLGAKPSIKGWADAAP